MRALIVPLALVSAGALAGPLNDTGIDFCRDHATGADTAVTTTTTCTAAQGGQDARYGRDPAAQRGAMAKVGGGSKGFDFTKIANNGTTLPASAALGSAATDWACTYDNNTGLMWEVKTTSGLRSQAHTYTWYDSAHNYGGNPGIADTIGGGGTCLTDGRCDTQTFVLDVNSAALCGHNDWRMPTVGELTNLADLGIASPGPTIDLTYFPNTPASFLWSGSPVVLFPGEAYGVNFFHGGDVVEGSGNAHPVRLVRAGK